MITKEQEVDFAQFVGVLYSELRAANHPIMRHSFVVETWARELATLAARSRRYAILDCNEGLSEGQKARAEKTDARAKEICRELGVGLQIGDVRGCAYRLLLPSGKSNSFGGEGWIVPEIRFF